MLKDGFATAESDMAARSLREAQVDAERMILATESALAADGDLLDADERAAVDALLARVRAAARDAGEPRAIEAAVEALAEGTEGFAAARMNRGIRDALAAATSTTSDDDRHQDPSPCRAVPRGQDDRRRARHLRVRGAAGERRRHRARLRHELRLHHLPRDRARGLRSLGEADETEDDLLDRAWGLTPQSRLSCQAIVAATDLVIEIPKYTINHARENH